MDWITLLRALGGLAITLALMFGAAYIYRRFVVQRTAETGNPQMPTRRLAVIEAQALDLRRKLVVVRWHDREHLLLVSDTGASPLASRDITPETPSPNREGA